jgi:hypothetical protein
MNLLIINGNLHNKNKEGLIKLLKKSEIQYNFGNINDIKNFYIIYSPSLPINSALYPKKKFIFGPHFSVFPDKRLLMIDNSNKNAIYIQPSNWVCKLWSYFKETSHIPLKQLCFPVNTDKFIPFNNKKSLNRTKIFIYFKRRKPEELTFLKTFLHNKNIEFKVFDYVKRYEEEDYLKYLQESKYGIILDAHESQGFAIEEALSCDVPLLVWNVRSLNQEEGVNYPDIPATSIPYWDERCGEYFYNKEEFEEKYKEFMNKLYTYKPREFVLENLSLEKCGEDFKKLINEL